MNTELSIIQKLFVNTELSITQYTFCEYGVANYTIFFLATNECKLKWRNLQEQGHNQLQPPSHTKKWKRQKWEGKEEGKGEGKRKGK